MIILNKKKNVQNDLKPKKYTYLITNYPTSDLDEELNDFKKIYTFDEHDICIDSRYCIDFKDEKRAEEEFNLYLSNNKEDEESSYLTNLEKRGTKVLFNTKVGVGEPKANFLNAENANVYIEY